MDALEVIWYLLDTTPETKFFQSVATNSTSTPILSPSLFATSISKPSYSSVAGFLKLQPGKSPVVPTFKTPL